MLRRHPTTQWTGDFRIFQTNHTWKASPRTYMFDGTQSVTAAAGSNTIALAIHG
jgi:hypothetical protein